MIVIYVTGTFAHLRNAWKINGFLVGLSDGNAAKTTHEGEGILPRDLKMTNVLFVPHLDCNLIFIPKLLNYANCI